MKGQIKWIGALSPPDRTLTSCEASTDQEDGRSPTRVYWYSTDSNHVVAEYVEKTVAVARSLGLPALGVYLAMFSVYVEILREMRLVEMAVEEIREARVHVDRMLDKALDEATGTVGDLQLVRMVEERNPVGDGLYRYRITVNGEVRFFDRREGFSRETVVSEFRELAVAEARASITKNLVDPSRKIMDVWNSASVVFSSGKHREE